MIKNKICKKCNKLLPIDMFQTYQWNGSFYKKNGEIRCKHTCKNCLNIYSKERYKNNPNVSNKAIKDASYWAKNNREKINIRNKDRRKNDPIFAARETLRSQIKTAFKKRNGSKNGYSFTKFLNYTIKDYICHMEKQFKLLGNEWMHFGNQGVYNPKTWDDNDQKTWVWQLDHIIPQSDFKFISMEDEEFQKCWALENLRPYSAKKNVSEGPAKIRHKKKGK